MDTLVSRAEGYRFRAEEIRTLSADWLDREAKAILARVAFDYDRMADHLERQARVRPVTVQ
jgi:hypothetical protein